MSNVTTLFEQPNKPQTPATVSYSAKMWRCNILSSSECVQLAQTILSKEGDLIAQNRDHTDDGGTGMGPDSLSAKFRAYNMFDWEDPTCLQIKTAVKHAVKEMYPNYAEQLYGRMWGCILRRGQAIKPHQHNFDEYSFLSGDLILQCEKTSNFYQNPFGLDAVEIENKAGYLSLYPEYLIHWCTQHKNSLVPRISIGIDVLPASAVQDTEHNLVKL